MRRFNSHFIDTLSVVFILFLFSKTFAQNTLYTSIPFVLEKNCIYFYATINKSEEIKFLLDTGANTSVVNELSKDKIVLEINGESENTGSNGTNTAHVSSNNLLAIGEINKDSFPFIIIPFGTTQFDAIIGTDFMKEYLLEIDFSQKEIRFWNNKSTLDLKEYNKMKLYFIDDYPAIKASFYIGNKKKKGYFGLDSGADDNLTFAAPFSKKRDLKNKLQIVGKAIAQGSDGSQYEMPIVKIEKLLFSEDTLINIPASLSQSTEGIDATKKMAGFFGNGVLKRFDTIIDFKNHIIYYKKNTLFTSNY